MFRRLLSVGGFTLLSRIMGFLRSIVTAAILGDGALSDTFMVALRAAQFLPQHLCRRRVQRGLRATLCRAAGDEGRGGSGAFRRRDLLLADGGAVRAPGRGADRDAVDRGGDGARFRCKARRGGARDGAVAHHVSLSHPDRRGGADLRHAQFARAFLGGGGMADLPQSRHHRCAGRGALVSQCRLCRLLGRADRRRPAASLHRLGRIARPCPSAAGPAALDAADEELSAGARGRHAWFGHGADRGCSWTR